MIFGLFSFVTVVSFAPPSGVVFEKGYPVKNGRPGKNWLRNLQRLIAVMEETRAYLAREGNDYSWSSWRDQDHALAEIDSILAELKNRCVPAMDVLFAPTGPIQEVSINSGWGDEFLILAAYFDEAYSIAKSGS